MSCKYNYIEQSDLSTEQKDIYTRITNEIWQELADSKLFTKVKIDGVNKLAMPKTNYGKALSRIATINATREAQVVRVVEDSVNPDYEIVKVNTSPLFSSSTKISLKDVGQSIRVGNTQEVFKGRTSVDAKTLLNEISQSKHPLAPLAKKLSENLNRTVMVYLRVGIVGGGRGEYYGEDDAIAINSQEVNPKGVESTILHEIIHALTFDKLYDENNKDVLERFSKLFNAAKKIHPNEYNTQNLDEFITGIFTNADFINKLKKIDAIDVNHTSLWQDVLDTILSLFGIKRGTSLYEQAFNVGSEIIQGKSLKDNEVKYTFKAISILQSQKGKEVFEKGKKNNWSLDKILTELAVPKEQKTLLLELGINDRDKLALELGSKYGFSVETNVVIQKNEYKANTTDGFRLNGFQYSKGFDTKGNQLFYKTPILDETLNPWDLGFTDYDKGESITKDEFYEKYEIAVPSNSPTQHYSNLTVPGGSNYTENEISTPLIIPAIKGHAQFATPNGIGWFRSDESQQYQETDIQSIIDNLQKSGQLEINCK